MNDEAQIKLHTGVCQGGHPGWSQAGKTGTKSGEIIECRLCGQPVACGYFMHACSICDQFFFQPCGKCRAVRLFCSC